MARHQTTPKKNKRGDYSAVMTDWLAIGKPTLLTDAARRLLDIE